MKVCLVVLAGLLSACVSFVHMPYEPGPRPFVPPATKTDPLFAYERSPVRVDNHVLDELETADYRVRELTFPSAGENGQDGSLVTGRYYQSKHPGAKPLVIVLPIWGTHTYPSNKTVKSFRNRSDGAISIFQLLGEDFLIDWPALRAAKSEEAFRALAARMAARMVTTVIDIRRIVDWAGHQPDVDPSRVGLVGFSLGAVVGGTVVTNEPRIAATVLVMGAADAGEIFVNCEGRAANVRKAVRDRFDWSLERYGAVMDAAFAAGDAANFPGRVDPAHVLMIDSKNDNCMPKSTRDTLWNVLGRPERLTFRYSHKGSFLAMTPLGFNFMSRRIYNFMADQLLE